MRTPRLIVASRRDGGQQSVHTTLTVAEAVRILEQMEGHQFAQSLAHDHYKYFDRGGLTGNRASWALVIAQQQLDRQAQRAQAPAVQLGNFGQISALFQHAGSRLKYPKLTLSTPSGREVELALCGARSKTAGSIAVNNGLGPREPGAVFYGYIHPDGAFEQRRADQEVLDLLVRFAANPAGVAAEYGRRTGRCCFCSLALTDERSLAEGYGPVCAQNYNLPWGNRRRPQSAIQRRFSELEESSEFEVELAAAGDDDRRIGDAVGRQEARQEAAAYMQHLQQELQEPVRPFGAGLLEPEEPVGYSGFGDAATSG